MGVYYRDSIFTVPFDIWLLKFLGFALGISLLWLIVRRLYVYLVKHYPGYANQMKRRIRILFIYLIFTLLLFFASTYVRPLIDVEFPSYKNPHIGLEYLMGSIMFFVDIYLYESFHLFEEFKNLKIRETEIQKEKITSELANLKNQISPHFLFNSLNTLVYLIDVDKEKGKEFVHKLAYVYKCILETSDKNLVPLHQELRHISAYTELLKQRFGDNVHFNFKIDEMAHHKKIVPLAVQLAIENAVKHNIISKKQPLDIDIYTTANHLIVKNNLQKKKSDTVNYGLGLKNITNRYQLLTTEEVIIEDKAMNFVLKLPLIKE